jgi:hypothetical protein
LFYAPPVCAQLFDARWSYARSTLNDARRYCDRAHSRYVSAMTND